MNDKVQLVTCVLGDIPEADLRSVIKQEEDYGNTVGLAREWFYIGADPQFADYVNKMVRRDVWITIKQGLSAEAIGH